MASLAMPPVPSRNAAQPPSPPPPMTAQGMVGSPHPAEMDQAKEQARDENRQFVTRIRAVHDNIDDLARMRPEFAPFARAAKDALTKGMVKTIGSSRPGAESEPSTPAST